MFTDDDYDDVIAGTVTPTSVIIIVIVAIIVRRYIIRRRNARRYRSLIRNRFHLQRVHNELVEEQQQQQHIDVPPATDDQTSVKQRSYESVQVHAHPSATPRAEPKYANVAPRAPVQGGACAYPDAVSNEHAVFHTPERRGGACANPNSESTEHIYEAFDFKTPCATTPPSRQRACTNAATMTSPTALDTSSKSLPSETDALTGTHDSNDSTMTIDLSGDCGEPPQPDETRL